MNWFWRSGFILTVLVKVVFSEDVQTECGNGTMTVKWKTSKDVEFSRVFLGTCFPTPYDVTEQPGGRMEIVFRVRLQDCRIKRQISGKLVVFRTNLTYKPLPKWEPPVFTIPIECAFRRPKEWVGIQEPGYGTAFAHGSLLFYMGIANADFSGPAQTSTFPLGSLIPISAAVDQQNHLPLLLLLDECVATTSPEPDPFGPFYPIISHGGCLLDSRWGNSRFLPRRRSSELNLLLQAFAFALGQEVYVHCTVVAWDLQVLNIRRKACQYIKELEGWELLDDPLRSSLCSCCESHCTYRDRRSLDSGAQGVTHRATVGPFTIIDGSQESQLSVSGRDPGRRQEHRRP